MSDCASSWHITVGNICLPRPKQHWSYYDYDFFTCCTFHNVWHIIHVVALINLGAHYSSVARTESMYKNVFRHPQKWKKDKKKSFHGGGKARANLQKIDSIQCTAGNNAWCYILDWFSCVIFFLYIFQSIKYFWIWRQPIITWHCKPVKVGLWVTVGCSGGGCSFLNFNQRQYLSSCLIMCGLWIYNQDLKLT